MLFGDAGTIIGDADGLRALRDAYDFSTGAQLTRYKRVRGRAYEDDDGAPP